MIGELFPEERQRPAPQFDPVAGPQWLTAGRLPVYPARCLAAQIDVDVLVALVTADLGLVSVQPLQTQVRVWSAPDDRDARQQVELTLAGMLRRGIAEREDQARPAAVPWVMCGHHQSGLLRLLRVHRALPRPADLTQRGGVHRIRAALALWNPPPFLTGCSQAAVLDGGPALIRNYDWDYRLFDGVVAKTAYTGRRVLGMVDCLWGLLDGVNDAGLAVSLTFGGRPQVGEGFGIPLVIRYVLEVCGTVDEAVQVLRRVPVHMSYNVTVLDRCGQWATVYVAPDRPPRVTDRAVATNHQGSVEWAPYATAIRSVEREQRLEELLAHGAGVADLIEACLRPPLYATRFHHGFGTLYTAEYRPADGIVRYHWPQRRWEQSLDNIKTDSIQLQLGTP